MGRLGRAVTLFQVLVTVSRRLLTLLDRSTTSYRFEVSDFPPNQNYKNPLLTVSYLKLTGLGYTFHGLEL